MCSQKKERKKKHENKQKILWMYLLESVFNVFIYLFSCSFALEACTQDSYNDESSENIYL